MSIKAINSIGKRYGRLKVLEIFYKHGRAWTKCLCACDRSKRKLHEIRLDCIRDGNTQSCSCLHKELTSKAHYKHGENIKNYRSIEYRVWDAMIQRCYNPNAAWYIRYGGRGITVYKKWHKYKPFLKYLLKTIGRRPSPIHSIDRINNDGNYEPGNIRWATPYIQTHNRF